MAKVSKDISLRDGKVFFGEHESTAWEESTRYDNLDDIATRYVVRVWNGDYWQIGTTLDVCKETGLLWLCGFSIKGLNSFSAPSVPSAYYREWSSIKHILDELCERTAGKKWKVFEEEPSIQVY